MSHELRTPLNAVIGFSEVLLDRMFGELNERQDEYLRDIWNSGKHLLELLNEILDLSKVEAGQMVLEPSTFPVTTALEYCVTMLRERATQHAITVTVEVADEIATIDADERKFKQVVLNLVSNAVKFTPDGGSVAVRAYREDGDLLVTVTDTGIGVPAEDQERIFESFQQGRRGAPKEEGTGLGLTLSRRFVWLWGGRMWLESTPGDGSTFGFSIPGVLRGDEVVPEDLPAILLVDDDRASLDLNAAYLDGSPTRVLRARDGVEALEAARNERPAAVVLEVGLPKRDGWQVVADLKADPATATIPVIIATDVDDRARGLALGADSYLRKPIGREELIEALKQVGAL
jgi:CheY-like chemotaxis protein